MNYRFEEETIEIEIPVPVAQCIVGTLDVDREIAEKNGNDETAATFEEWMQPFIDELRKRHERHFEDLDQAP